MDISTKTDIINKIQNFPIGGVAKTHNELLAKAGVILYLSRFEDKLRDKDMLISNILMSALDLSEEETIPDIIISSNTLKLPDGFFKDLSNINLIKRNSESYDEMFNKLIQIINDYGFGLK